MDQVYEVSINKINNLIDQQLQLQQLIRTKINPQNYELIIDNIDYELEIIQQSIQNIISIIEDSNITDQKQQQLSQNQKNNSLNNYNFNYQLTNKIKGHQSKIYCLAISQDNQYIASGDKNGKIVIWNLNNQSIINEYQNKTGAQIYSLLFSFINKLLFVASGEDIIIFKFDYKLKVLKVLKDCNSNTIVLSLQKTHNPNYLISVNQNQTLKLWDIQQNKILSIQTFNSKIYGVQISWDNQYMSCCCQNGNASLFSIFNFLVHKLLVEWKAGEYCCDTTFTLDSTAILVSTEEIIKIWKIEDLLKNNQANPYQYFNCTSYCTKLSIDGSILLCTNYKQINIYNFQNKSLIRSLSIPNQSNYNQLIFTPDLRSIISANYFNLYIYQILN